VRSQINQLKQIPVPADRRHRSVRNRILIPAALCGLLSLTIVAVASLGTDKQPWKQQATVVVKRHPGGVFQTKGRPAYAITYGGKAFVIQEKGTTVTFTEIQTDFPPVQGYGLTSDGKYYVYATGMFEPKVLDLQTGRSRDLGPYHLGVFVSPVDYKFAFFGPSTQERLSGLYVGDIDTDEVKKISDEADNQKPVAWSSSGSEVFFYTSFQEDSLRKLPGGSIHLSTEGSIVYEPRRAGLNDAEQAAQPEESPSSFPFPDTIVGHRSLSAQDPIEGAADDDFEPYTLRTPNGKISIYQRTDIQTGRLSASLVYKGEEWPLGFGVGTTPSGLVLNNGTIVSELNTTTNQPQYVFRDWSGIATSLEQISSLASTSTSYYFPLKQFRVTQGSPNYGSSSPANCKVFPDPFNHTNNLAYSYDMQGSEFENVLAAADGLVSEVVNNYFGNNADADCHTEPDPYKSTLSTKASYGSHVVLRHPDGTSFVSTTYGHLKSGSIPICVVGNQQVPRGGYLGQQGHSGTVNGGAIHNCGDHVHFQQKNAQGKTIPIVFSEPNYPPELSCTNYTSSQVEITTCNQGSGGFSFGVSPTTVSVTAGNVANYNLNFSSVNNWGGTITASVSGLPSGASCPSRSITLPAGGTATLGMPVSTGSGTPSGNYQLTYTCVSGSISHSQSVSLTVSPPANHPGLGLSSSTSLLTVTQGFSKSLVLSVNSLNGFVGTVTPFALNLPQNRVLLGTGFSPNQASIGPTGSAQFTFNYNTDSSISPGSYVVTFVARSGAIESNSVAVTFVIQAPSTPDLYPTSFNGPNTVNAGGSYAYTVGLRNQGTGSAGQFQVGLYLSLDSSSGGSRIGNAVVGGLSAGANSSVSVTATFPVNLSGNLWLRTIVDDQGQVAESNEGNNRWDYGWVYINPTSAPPIAWEFNSGTLEGWGSYNLAAYVIQNGKWIVDPNAGDYYLIGPAISANASIYRYVVLSLASNATDYQGYIYFKTASENFFSEDKKVFFRVNNCSLCSNAPFYSYSVYMANNGKWTGTITAIRLDPSLSGTGGTNRDSIGLDYIRLVQNP